MNDVRLVFAGTYHSFEFWCAQQNIHPHTVIFVQEVCQLLGWHNQKSVVLSSFYDRANWQQLRAYAIPRGLWPETSEGTQDAGRTR